MAGCNFRWKWLQYNPRNRCKQSNNCFLLRLRMQKRHFKVLHSSYGNFWGGTVNVHFEHKPHICFSMSTILNQEGINITPIVDGCWNKYKKTGHFEHVDGYIQCFYFQANLPRCKLCIVSCPNEARVVISFTKLLFSLFKECWEIFTESLISNLHSAWIIASQHFLKLCW